MSNNNEASLNIFNYNNVFISCFYDDERLCVDRCSDFGLNYVYSGEMQLSDGNKTVSITKGECVFVPRDFRLTMSKQPKDGERYMGIFLRFQRKFLKEMFDVVGAGKIKDSMPKLPSEALKLPKTAELESLFASMVPFFNSEVPANDDMMRLKLQEGLLALLHIDPRFAPTMFDFSDPWKIDILDFMNENYAEDLSTEDMAHYTGRSLASFKRDFKKVSDLTPEKWVTHKRLEEAYVMLSKKDGKIVDICHKVGFKSPTHFSTAFKRQYGMTPTKFMEQMALL